VASTANLDANAGNLQFHAGLPPLFAFLFSAFSATLDRNSFSITISRFDTLLLANGPGTFLSAHAIGHRLRNQCCRGRYRGGDREGEYHPHDKILLEVVALIGQLPSAPFGSDGAGPPAEAAAGQLSRARASALRGARSEASVRLYTMGSGDGPRSARLRHSFAI
jgi:hypothetical protein